MSKELADKLLKGADSKYYVAVVPVNPLGEVLVGERREDGIWTTPCGGAEAGEDPIEVAVRECWEEAGLKVDRSRLEFLRVTMSPNGRAVYCFLYRAPMGGSITTKLDPDKEIKMWNWVLPESEMFPRQFQRKNNLNRLETINDAMLRFHGLAKGESMSKEKTLAEKLLKGGEGSGIKGHVTRKDLMNHPQWNGNDYNALDAKGYKGHEIKAIWDKDHARQEKPVDRKPIPDAVGVAGGKRPGSPHKIVDTKYHAPRSPKPQTDKIRQELGSRPQPKPHDKTKASQERISAGVAKFKDKQPQGMGMPEARAWFAGMGMNKTEVDLAVKMVASKIRKSEITDADVQVLADKLLKGGEGSGVKGHKTAAETLQIKGMKRGDVEHKDGSSRVHFHDTEGKHFAREREGRNVEELHGAVGKLLSDSGHGHVKHRIGEGEKGHFSVELKDNVEKGGEGSGKVGHTTLNPAQSKKLAGMVPAAKNKLQTHLHALKHGAVLPNVATASGKPIVHDMEATRAHKYTLQDHRDAIDVHHQHAKRIGDVAEKLKSAGKKVPQEAKDMVNHHVKQMKAHMREHDQLEMKHNALQQSKEKANPGMKKASTQMGGGIGDPDIDTGNFTQAQAHGPQEFMQSLYRGMSGYQYGESPREFPMDKGMLHLSQVDDGMYSGYFTNHSPDGLMDNARVRIDKITIPDLAALCNAKEWNSQIKSESALEKPQAVTDSWTDPTIFAPPPPQAINNPPFAPIKKDEFGGGQPVSTMTLSGDVPLPPTSLPQAPNEPDSDKAIRILTLVSKLMGKLV